MKKEMQDNLYSRYPELFTQANWTIGKTCMCWGICTGDGWFNIINNLCSEIMSYCAVNNKRVPEFSQIKEELGALAVNIDYGDNIIWDLIKIAQGESEMVCEYCGVFGSEANITTEGTWLKTLCAICRNKNEEDKERKSKEMKEVFEESHSDESAKDSLPKIWKEKENE